MNYRLCSLESVYLPLVSWYLEASPHTLHWEGLGKLSYMCAHTCVCLCMYMVYIKADGVLLKILFFELE